MGDRIFNELDAAILYAFPKPPSDLSAIVRCFRLFNRCAAPTYGDLTSCLTKALSAGIIRQEGGRFVVEETWYDRVHRHGVTAENEVEAMLAFAETFVNREVPRTTEAANVLSRSEYDAILSRECQ